MERIPKLTKAVSVTALAAALVWGKDAKAAEITWCRDEGSAAIAREQVRECVSSVEIEEPDFLRPLDKIIEIVKTNSTFSEVDLADITMYGEIYMRVGEKYGIPWYLLWIVHKAESNSSRNPDAFNGKSEHTGGFQRHLGWSSAKVDAAAEGLEGLESLPQRHPTDWREAAFAGWHLANIRKDDDDPIRGALRAYSAQAPAYIRYQEFLKYQKIFEPDY